MAFGQASAPAPYPPWVSWAIHQGMMKAASEWDALLPQVQVAIQAKYLEVEAGKLGLLAQQAPPPNAFGDPSLQDHLNGLTRAAQAQKRGIQGPYAPMDDRNFGKGNVHNTWFKEQDFDPISLLGARLRRKRGEALLPFDFYTSYCNDSYVWITYVVGNDMITLRDDAHAYPSDELIATLRLAIEAVTR